MRFVDHPILEDFELFLRYISHKQPLLLTTAKRCLRSADLVEINDKLNHPARKVNPKSTQNAFSLLHSFFHIAKVAELIRINTDSRKLSNNITLQLQADRVEQYQALSADEQFFFLLEGFWQYLDAQEVYGYPIRWESHFYQAVLEHPVGKRLTIAEPRQKRKGVLRPVFDLAGLEMLEAFGCFTLEWGQQFENRPKDRICPYQALTLSDLGEAMLHVLWPKGAAEMRPFLYDLDPYMSENAAMKALGISKIDSPMVQEQVDSLTGVKLLVSFQQHFPSAIINKRLFPIERPFQDGTYTLKIALDKKLYRVIAIDAQATLEDLHEAIQSIYDFDNDHLYAFFMDNEAWSRTGDSYFDPRGEMDDQKPADAFQLGEVGLYVKQAFLYLFDFGDQWAFEITVESISPIKAKSKQLYRLIETQGKAPAQYDWEEEDDD